MQKIIREARADDDERAARIARLGAGELVGERELAALEAHDPCQRVQGDAGRGQGAR